MTDEELAEIERKTGKLAIGADDVAALVAEVRSLREHRTAVVEATTALCDTIDNQRNVGGAESVLSVAIGQAKDRARIVLDAVASESNPVSGEEGCQPK